MWLKILLVVDNSVPILEKIYKFKKYIKFIKIQKKINIFNFLSLNFSAISSESKKLKLKKIKIFIWEVYL